MARRLIHYPAERRISVSSKGQLTGPSDPKVGLTKAQQDAAEAAFRKEYTKPNDIKSYPAKTYFRYIKTGERCPLLMIYYIELNMKNVSKEEIDFIDNYGQGPMISIAVGLPRSDSDEVNFRRVAVNQIYLSDIDEGEED